MIDDGRRTVSQVVSKVKEAWYQALAELQPLPEAPRWVVGVSGGPDSMVLLHVLSQFIPKSQLLVAHLDHGWRPEAADEAAFVQKTAEKWGLACYVAERDVPAYARRAGISLEEAGRVARYEFMVGIAMEMGVQGVVVGHHADDQTETVLLNLLRGTGLAGLRGMKPVSRVPVHPDMPLLRPLLNCRRAEIVAYCDRHQLHPVYDPSNEDMTFLRNRLRQQTLPHLRQINPKIDVQLPRMAAVLAADEALLDELTAEKWPELLLADGIGWLELDLPGWRALPLSLRRRLLRRIVLNLKPMPTVEVTFVGIEAAREILETAVTGQKAILPGGIVAEIVYERLRVALPETLPPIQGPQLMEPFLNLPVPGQVALANGWLLTADWRPEITGPDYLHNRDPWQAFVAVPDGGDMLAVRSRMRGERWQPLGMAGKSTKLKETMINRMIPAAERKQWPLVTNREHILWLVGHQIDERARVTADADPVVWLRCYREEHGE